MNEERSTEVIIIGTMHGGHIEAEHYTQQALEDIIICLEPDAICVELCQKHLDADGTLKPGILEEFKAFPDVQAVHDAATRLGVRQVPFDFEGRDEAFERTNYFELEAQAIQAFEEWFERIKKTVPNTSDYRLACVLVSMWKSQQEMGLHAASHVINSGACDEIIRAKHDLFHYILPAVMRRYPEMQDTAATWEMIEELRDERNRIMAENLVRIAADHAGKRLVVTAGDDHRYALRDLLADKPGIVLREYWEVLGS